MSDTAIASLIPHTGTMCLLDRVMAWDAATLTASAISHCDPANPLRQRGRLGSLCGVEYAGQAMAAHGRLTGAVSARPRQGFLIGLRDVTCHVAALDMVTGDLIVAIEKLMGDEAQVIYRFVITGGGQALIEGRATVILQSEDA